MLDLTNMRCVWFWQLNLKASEFYRLVGLDEQNDNIYGVVPICNPFKGPPNYNYVPESCPTDAIRISQLPDVSNIVSAIGLVNFIIYDHPTSFYTLFMLAIGF